MMSRPQMTGNEVKESHANMTIILRTNVTVATMIHHPLFRHLRVNPPDIVVDARHRKGMMTHLRKGVNAAVIGRHTLNRINITVPCVSKLFLLNLKLQLSTMIGVNEIRRHASWPLLTEPPHSCYGSCMSHPMIR